MKYGCIGERLIHSFSREIHTALSDHEYELKEIPRYRLSDFLEAKEFSAINVTIPYKEAVIPHLFSIDDAAKRIGAVNTIVNKDGKLFGYNTDFYGMQELLSHAGVSVLSKKVAILGSGGTAKTADREVLLKIGRMTSGDVRRAIGLLENAYYLSGETLTEEAFYATYDRLRGKVLRLVYNNNS